ncbi:MAG: hypothetical protein KatS3mg011_1749 [Acidimicrobiia bacterium]|nr:MAG: hypothetical protein KatS3mg011_1749 [Acidimicrobiia bacterium]
MSSKATAPSMSMGRLGVLLPYWDFWEGSAGGPSFRDEREGLLQQILGRLADLGFDPVGGGLIDSSTSGARGGRALAEANVAAILIVQSMAVPPVYALAALDELPELPVVIWALQSAHSIEPGFNAESITKLGSTVGTPMLTNVLHRRRRAFDLVVGSLGATTYHRVSTALRAALVAGSLRGARIARMGKPIPGYECCDASDEDLAGIGLEVVNIEPRELQERYLTISADSLVDEVSSLKVEGAPGTLEISLRLARALEAIDDERGIAAGAINCHVPEIRFSEDPGITPCLALGRETTRGVPWTCTGDVLTAVAMLVGKRLTGASLYHEIEAIDFDTGEVAIANSGEHDLAWCKEGCQPTLRPNPWFNDDQKTGTIIWFELPPGPATLIGFTKSPDDPGGLRLVAAEGRDNAPASSRESDSRRTVPILRSFHRGGVVPMDRSRRKPPQRLRHWARQQTGRSCSKAPRNWIRARVLTGSLPTLRFLVAVVHEPVASRRFTTPKPFAGLTVDEHRDIPVAPTEAGFVNQQDTAAAAPAGGHHQIRPPTDQAHDVVPRQVVAAGDLPDRQVVHITNDLASEAAGDVGAASQNQLGVVLGGTAHSFRRIGNGDAATPAPSADPG